MRKNRDQVEAELRREMSEILGSDRSMELDAADLGHAVAVLQSRQPGWQPGSATANINARTRDIRPAELRQLLEQMAGSGRDRGARFDRPPRRSPELLGIVPAQARMRNRICVLAVIDTSGSMDDATLASIASILRIIEDAAELTVVECDTAIHRVYPFSGMIRSVVGRGGTDFRPPLEPAFLARTHAEAVVYFTDGEGRAPAKRPEMPVIWALTHGGSPPACWGKVLRVES